MQALQNLESREGQIYKKVLKPIDIYGNKNLVLLSLF